ncbi:acyltransferase family protein [Terrabacter sp. LjRoot27]|uniref:acyltransferase family protein n=1 Tax=Terrabacter sp. LjRoot27 TaxID=3342306 RepID=UPI003ECC3DBF
MKTAAVGAVDAIKHRGRRRSDIQALRALAVVLVVAQHFFGLPRAGFVGVDVFFVVSGFLITTLLIAEARRDGDISLSAFYARRLRRILPAAVFVLGVTVAVGFIVWFPSAARQNALDAFSAALWVSNYHFAATGADYLSGSDLAPALQHYWSLSVEEQFYLVWPALLMALLAVDRSRWPSSRRLLTSSLLALVVGGFIFSVIVTHLKPQFAYFDTFSRVWELAAGGLVAAHVASGGSSLRGRRPGLWSAIGFLLILFGAFTLSPSWAFPGPWAVVPVIGTACVLIGRPGTRLQSLLDRRPIQGLGDISYSLYLWHMPLLIIPLSLFGELSHLTKVAITALALALSVVTFRWIEDPIRRSGWLRSWERGARPRRQLLVSAALCLVVGAAAAAQFATARVGVLEAATFSHPRELGSVDFVSQAQVQQSIQVGLSRQGYSGTTPSAESLGPEQLASTFDVPHGCSNALGRSQLDVCSFGRGSRTIMVVGDSVAMAWVPTVVAAAPASRILAVGVPSCSPWDVEHGTNLNMVDYSGACRLARAGLLERIREERPDVVVVSSSVGSYSKVLAVDRSAAGAAGTRSTLHSYLEAAEHIVVIENPPVGGDVRHCVNRVATPQTCTTTVSTDQVSKTQSEQEASLAFPGRVSFVPVVDWFCDAEKQCPAVVGPYLTRVDPTHITDAFARALGPLLREAAPELQTSSPIAQE